MSKATQPLFFTTASDVSDLESMQKLLMSSGGIKPTIKVNKIERIDKGLGFTSYIYRVSLSDSENPNCHSCVVVKLPTAAKLNGTDDPDSKIPKFDIDIKLIYGHHNREVKFYQMVGELDILYSLKIPTLYGGSLYVESDPHPNPFMIMADVCSDANADRIGRVPDMMQESLSLPQIRQMIHFLACLHAFSLQNPMWIEKGNCPNLNEETVQMHIGIAKSAVVTLRRDYPAEFTLTDAELESLFDQTACCEAVLGGDSPKVIVHGDLWSNNFIYRKSTKEDRMEEELLGVLDWQTPYPGHCGTDLARLLTSSVDFNLRRQYETQLVAEYYQLLKEKLPKDYQIPWQLSDVQRLYKKALRYGSVEFFLNVPFSFVFAPWSHEVRVAFVDRLVANVGDALSHSV